MPKKNKVETKRKISKKKIFVFFFIIFIILFIFKLCNTNITNIYISGNEYLTDQEIIDISKLSNYPNSISNLSLKIEKRLKNNQYITDVNVKKNILLNKVYIDIKENYPLFYYHESNKTILYSGKEIDDKIPVLAVINFVPNNVYELLIEKIRNIEKDILDRMSEIEYAPNDRYEDRFLILMNDGNYIYITLKKFSTLNRYLDIIKHMDLDEKGIIRLDSGEYFEKFN